MPATAAMRRAFVLVPFMLVAALVITMVASAPADALTKRERKIRHSTHVALNQLGDPYRYGANGPNAFDCSGLTQFAAKRSEMYLPRSSDAQYRYSRHIKKRNIERGDYMFFHSGGDIYHVAIFLGRRDGKVRLLHASRSGTPVKRDTAWTRSWYAGTLRRR
ncbi:MAG: C40 family peptidase [Nocardioidaceae bacterium]